jgi:hypothetical protein
VVVLNPKALEVVEASTELPLGEGHRVCTSTVTPRFPERAMFERIWSTRQKPEVLRNGPGWPKRSTPAGDRVWVRYVEHGRRID